MQKATINKTFPKTVRMIVEFEGRVVDVLEGKLKADGTLSKSLNESLMMHCGVGRQVRVMRSDEPSAISVEAGAIDFCVSTKNLTKLDRFGARMEFLALLTQACENILRTMKPKFIHVLGDTDPFISVKYASHFSKLGVQVLASTKDITDESEATVPTERLQVVKAIIRERLYEAVHDGVDLDHMVDTMIELLEPFLKTTFDLLAVRKLAAFDRITKFAGYEEGIHISAWEDGPAHVRSRHVIEVRVPGTTDEHEDHNVSVDTEYELAEALCTVIEKFDDAAFVPATDQ